MLTISVVIPCYNRAHTVGKAIASVHAQTRAPLELVIVDDGSSDASADIAERAGARVIRLEENRGNAAARNVGIQSAAGEVIAWLDSDDYWEPHHLATVAALLDAYPDAAVASAAVRFVGTRSGTWYGAVPAGPPGNVTRQAFCGTVLPMGTAVVRRDALIAIGGFDETERVAVDFDLWLRLSYIHHFVATRDVTANYLWHPGQLSDLPERQWEATYRFRRRALDRMQDGDFALRADLSEIFRKRWEADLWTAWEQRRTEWLRRLVALAPLVPDVPWTFKWSWTFRSRIPAPAVPLLRAAYSNYASNVLPHRRGEMYRRGGN